MLNIFKLSFFIGMAVGIICIIIIICECSEKSVTGNIEPIGKWFYIESIDQRGTITVDLSVVDDRTYNTIAQLSDGSNTITISTESGIWETNNGILYLLPGMCHEYDFEDNTLKVAICSGGTSLSYNDSTMTNGSVIFNRYDNH